MRLKNFGLISVGAVAGVLISLGITATASRETRGPLPLEDVQQFSRAFEIIKNAYVEPVSDQKLMKGAIQGMLSDLDPHSAYLNEQDYRILQESIRGRFGGLGIEVGFEDGLVKVISPIEDTPAFRAGVRAGDFIIKIDDTNVKGITLDQAVGKMRGEPGTKVVLTLARKGEDKPLVLPLTRDIIKVVSVKSNVIEPGYAWVRLTSFQERTVEDLARRLEELGKKGPVKGLILDLRNNPGGLLPAAVGVSAAFLPKDSEVVSSKGQLQESRQEFYARLRDYSDSSGDDPLRMLPAWAKNVPMVVLVNGASASASEIVAGALQDHKRAKVMGAQTFGKGSVQTIVPVDRERATAIKLTTARYYTPSGNSIQAKGIVPDLKVTDTADGDLFPDRPREVDLDKHLINDKDPAAEKAKRKLEELVQLQNAKTDKKPPKPIDFGSAEDFQLKQAINQLKGLPVQLAKASAEKPAAVESATSTKPK
jgi:carboxyl-terminal processing protease